jgi:hypothetical protein
MIIGTHPLSVKAVFYHLVNGPHTWIGSSWGIASSDVVYMGRGSRKMTVIYPEETSPFDGERRCGYRLNSIRCVAVFKY